jgi:hypothetical protein
MVYTVTAGTGYVGRMDTEHWYFEQPAGTATLDITLLDEAGGVIPSCPVIIRNAAETTRIAGPSGTDHNGQVNFELEAGSYSIRLGPLSGYDFSSLTGTDGTTTGSGHPYSYTLAAAGADLDLTAALAAQRFDGYTFLDIRTAVYSVIQQQYGTAAVGPDQVKLWVRAANVEVDARLRWSKGIMNLVSVADQRNYRLWEAPLEVLEVMYDGAQVSPIDWNEYLRYYTSDNGVGNPVRWTRWADDIYLHPTPEDTGKTIQVYMRQAPPLLNQDTDLPAVPPEFHRAIVDCALAMAFGDIKDGQQAAAYYLQKYQAEMQMAGQIQQHRGNLRIQVRRE